MNLIYYLKYVYPTKLVLMILFTANIVLCTIHTFSQGVAISEIFANPHPSSILDLQSTTKGMLVPRLTQLQRDSISNGLYGYSPTESLMIYNTTTHCFEFWAFNSWHQLGCAEGKVPGQVEYTNPGEYVWVAPEDVNSISILCIGGGGGSGSLGAWGGGGTGGGGGGLGYMNNFTVTPGNAYTIVVGAAGGHGENNNGFSSYFYDSTLVKGGGGLGGYHELVAGSSGQGGLGGLFIGNGGGNGGKGGDGHHAGYRQYGGGGGAGGYSGNGGNGGYIENSSGTYTYILGTDGTGGGGAGDGIYAKAGGGVGIYGQGSNGISGGVQQGSGGIGPLFGGGRGGNAPANGGHGAVRIIWPGDERFFPSTRTEDE